MSPIYPLTTSARWAWGVLVVLLGLLWLLAASPPWLDPGARAVAYRIWAPVCHQLPGRSLHFDATPIALCHRCFAIFSGLLLAAVAFGAAARFDDVLMRRSRLVLGAALGLVGVDWLLDVVGLWANTPLSRSATGLVFGLAAGYFLTRGFVDLGRGGGRKGAGEESNPAPVSSLSSLDS